MIWPKLAKETIRFDGFVAWLVISSSVFKKKPLLTWNNGEMLTNQSITKPIYIFVSHHHHKLPHTFLLVIMSLGNNSELYLVTACGFQPKIGAFFGGFYKLTETTQNIWNICKHKKPSARNSENLSLKLKLNILTE